ncbi:MAG: bifunctional folylpolyglutamate synthase/dihydrofolate synthase [Brevundimonas sp.]|uniref:Dihydrofolate synthase/folylpolyglutamate synthase n=1 Tax=Brevundimonas albigilva TaxID=1312364 RepID=A0ABY4SS74_9CAUL|nr:MULTISPECIES: folylpolyglutamate synthase/dihydrofolate synthase family protein [Brevundimonas]MCV0415476.1 bifunctional folylpolyglutamate synthase/dihydrofolate synthase [Brevundimonas sp.]PZU61933.1 MAG: bifunctional folylpolyglutamate synthase/dihydrofolate synthase [Brevundimonas sp.]UQV19556.1 bifunctional folylpolyglutamate synthase/dihydrofolate synthase [Brevundimonas albigilva]URI15535.1 bifunctional folylpolyglutamate synthase/dihydrofolate synthase [Brevundimonas albigilva]
MDPISERLRARHPQRIDLSLDRMRALCAALGDPQHRLPPVVHVAGTNGKGSTVAFLRAIAEAAGLRVHAYTSPHLVRFNERIRLAGRLIEDEALNAVLDRIEAVSGQATVFESTTAAAFVAMSETPADLAIVEVGLGGVLDATNVIERPLLSVIAPVDYDHAEFLGTDLAVIASEKAGVLKAGAPAVIGRQREEAMAAIERRATDVRARLTVLGVDFDAWAERGGLAFQTADLFMDLPAPALAGTHQIDNAALAIAAALELDLPEAAIAEGLRTARWPARLQRITAGPYGEAARAADAELWLDGGHNPHAGRALAAFLTARQARAPRPLALICGMLANKDQGGFFEALKETGATVFTVGFEGAAAEPSALAAVARGHGLGATAAGSVDEALKLALRLGAGRVAICGSLYLAGEVLGSSRETWPD